MTLGISADDIIVDPFAGSLTTLKIAKDMGYRAIGCELSKTYIDEGIDRLENITMSETPSGAIRVKQLELTG